MQDNILNQIKKLESKYEAMGQDLSSYLDGLLYADYLTYWDYVHLDTLLSLQSPKTSFPDETIFITYHQITELYFKLVLHEIDQIITADELNREILSKHLNRINRYFDNLSVSFDIMVDGLDKEQFLKFRMSLLPSSGFQSYQYRMIEISFTDLYNLVHPDRKDLFSLDSPVDQLYQNIYWKFAAIELASGKKTLTLKQFEDKYDRYFKEKAKTLTTKNISRKISMEPTKLINDHEIIGLLKSLDYKINVSWCLAHYKSAVRHLQKTPDNLAATGGTNWQKYLPPKFQRIQFFPDLWDDEEAKQWGKKWVMQEVLNQA